MAKIINMFAKGDEDKRVVANKNSNWRESQVPKILEEEAKTIETLSKGNV